MIALSPGSPCPAPAAPSSPASPHPPPECQMPGVRVTHHVNRQIQGSQHNPIALDIADIKVV